ncbi:hypothetical protein WJX73_004036 [Symbiochloris irregularis]|uniref:Uncharacterized protein n=1 Tax=Symbiochloris irregularis TaxID=706552 RepID=A0AAW1P8P9_9CHLO
MLHTVTQLTSITFSGPAYELGTEHLAALSALRVIDLSNACCTISKALMSTLETLRLLMISEAHLDLNSIPRPDWERADVIGCTRATGHQPAAESDSDDLLPMEPFRSRMEFVYILRSVSITGRSPENDAADAERLQLFDSFWHAHDN